jgi:hypothetical protein
MSLFHDSVEWMQQLKSLASQLTPGQDIPYSVFQDFLQFFNQPVSTWKIPYAQKGLLEEKEEGSESKQVHTEITSLTEQTVLQQTRQFLWQNFYHRLGVLDFSQGEVFQIEYAPLDYPDFQELDHVKNDEFPPHTIIYEACLENDTKFLRIWNIHLPNLSRFIYDDGESFTQYYEYAKLHIPKLDDHVNSEEDLYQVISAERKRHNNQCYATVAGQRDKAPGSIIYFYWATHFFFSAELFLDEESACPHMCYNPHLYPYPVQYFRAKNFRKFQYLDDEP